MFRKLQICLILVVSAVFVTAHPPASYSLARRGPQPPRNFRPFEDNWDTFCEDNDVPHNTWFVHPWGKYCQYYLVCYDGGTWPVACDDGYWATPGPQNTEGECVLVNDGDVCPNLPIFWPPNLDCPPPGSNELVFLPSEYYCDIFYVCINGIPIQTQCRAGQHWNANRNYCDDPSRAGCDGPNGPPVLPDCPIGESGAFPFPGDCTLFINCQANGNRSVQRCPHLHYFDIIRARCILFSDANCIDDYRGRR